MTAIIFENARIVDGTADRPSEPVQVLVEGGSIREVEKNIASASAQRIDLSGKTLMPGLIDAHVHVVASTADLGQNGMLPDALVTVRAFKIMGEMLARGFTTVRDVGGATSGLVAATLEAAWPTPRLNNSGKALAQTGATVIIAVPIMTTRRAHAALRSVRWAASVTACRTCEKRRAKN